MKRIKNSNMALTLNGLPQPIQPMVQSAMFYPNTYINFTQAGEYTKHYYNGTERICSRLGEQQIPISVENDQELLNYQHDTKEILRNAIGQHLYDEPTDMQEGEVLHLEYLQPCGNNNAVYYYHPNHLSSTMYVTDMQQSVVQCFLYAPYGEIISEYNTHAMGEAFPKYSFNAKELDEETGFYYYEARYYAPPTFTSRDPLFEKYFFMSPYAYCANNPVKYVDPTGCETHVAQNEDGTYRVIGGVLNKDRNIYVYKQDKDGNYTIKGNSIGITTSTTSFFNADANEGKGAWAVGSIINPNDKSGDNFLGNIFANTPTMIDDYMENARNGGKYDFKVTNGTDSPIPQIDAYRGMPIGETSNGQTIYSSARDIGNIAAGYIAGANGMSWEASRIAFDAYQSKVNGRPSIESISTRNAEMYGWRIGSYIKNNTPTQKANNLLKSIWNWITK